MATPAATPRRELISWLAGAKFTRLVAIARAAGAGSDAEDAVQDVLLRLSDATREVPTSREALVAYASTAVRRESYRRAGRPAVVEFDHDARTTPTEADADPYEARRAIRAFSLSALHLAPRQRAVIVLDIAGWSRARVAEHLGVSIRSVQRTLDDHRADVLARTAQSLDGSDCGRLAGTLEACAAVGWRPRKDGPLAAHLEICDGCRAAIATITATRRSLAALFPLPLLGLGSLASLGRRVRSHSRLAAGGAAATAVVAAVAMTGGATSQPPRPLTHDPVVVAPVMKAAPARRGPNVNRLVLPPAGTGRPAPTAHAEAVQPKVTAKKRRKPAAKKTPVKRPVVVAPTPVRAPAPKLTPAPRPAPAPDPCALGDSGICGLQ